MDSRLGEAGRMSMPKMVEAQVGETAELAATRVARWPAPAEMGLGLTCSASLVRTIRASVSFVMGCNPTMPPADGRIRRFASGTAASAVMRVPLVEHARAVPDLWEALQVDGPIAKCAFHFDA